MEEKGGGLSPVVGSKAGFIKKIHIYSYALTMYKEIEVVMTRMPHIPSWITILEYFLLNTIRYLNSNYTQKNAGTS